MLNSAAAVSADSAEMPPFRMKPPIHLMDDEASSSDSPTNPGSATSSHCHRPRLTLSAFRRPEQTVRLTQASAQRLEDLYDMRAKGCGILGHGAFSTVHMARRWRDGTLVAVKSIAKHDALRARRLRHRGGKCQLDEWEVMRQMHDHPHILTLLDVFETDEEIHLVTEYCQGGELFDAIQKKRSRSPAVRRGHYDEPQAACITSQLLGALAALHARNIVHRDVKPENILLMGESDDHIHAKLCDFGMARAFDRDGDSSDGETPPSTPGHKPSFCAMSCDYYAAPEVCAVGSAHQPSADVYSLGVTLYILICGFPPVFANTPGERGDVVFPETQWRNISKEAKELLQKMLHADPAKRISAANALQDKWIVQHLYRMPDSTAGMATSLSTLSGESASATPPLGRTINLDQVRSRLYNAIARMKEDSTSDARSTGNGSRKSASKHSSSWEQKKKKRSFKTVVSPRKKRRLECHRRSSIVCAMAELYCDMAAVSASATAAAAGVVCGDRKKDVRVIHDSNCDTRACTTIRYNKNDEEMESSPRLEPPPPAVSVGSDI